MDDAAINVPLVCRDDTVEAIVRPTQANDAAGGGLALSLQSVSFQKMQNSVAAAINPTSVNLNVNCSMQQQQLGQQQQQLSLLQQTNFDIVHTSVSFIYNNSRKRAIAKKKVMLNLTQYNYPLGKHFRNFISATQSKENPL
uniref:Uncharacterized protein n=1 Tax=Glossina austeni TaxID=7395 RepID=A0A1A9UMY1_GLOAU